MVRGILKKSGAGTGSRLRLAKRQDGRRAPLELVAETNTEQDGVDVHIGIHGGP